MVFFLIAALTIYALFDLGSTPSSKAQLLPRPVWALIILLLPVLGPAIWLLVGQEGRWFGQEDDDSARDEDLAPDDNPEFLRRVDWQVRRQQRRNEHGGDPAP